MLEITATHFETMQELTVVEKRIDQLSRTYVAGATRSASHERLLQHQADLLKRLSELKQKAGNDD